MINSDIADTISRMLLGFSALALLALFFYHLGEAAGEAAHEDDYGNGWIAGIDYERQREPGKTVSAQ